MILLQSLGRPPKQLNHVDVADVADITDVTGSHFQPAFHLSALSPPVIQLRISGLFHRVAQILSFISTCS